MDDIYTNNPSPLVGGFRLRRKVDPQGVKMGDTIHIIREIRSLTGWGLYNTKVRVANWSEFSTDKETALRILGATGPAAGCFEALAPYGMTDLTGLGGAMLPGEELIEGVLIVWTEKVGNKIPAIKDLRDATGLGIREAKDLVNGGQFPVSPGAAKVLVGKGNFAYTAPPPNLPPSYGGGAAGLDPNTVNDIRALVFLARIGFGTIGPTLDAGNQRFIEETLARLATY